MSYPGPDLVGRCQKEILRSTKPFALTLIKSISGIRGTLGGRPGENLTPLDVVSSTAAFGQWLLQHRKPKKVVVGRDARPSGPLVQALAMQTLVSLGFEVIDLGLSTTPTVEMAVPAEKAGGGIILTASHNPIQWNALKLLNDRGEFISKSDGESLLALLREGQLEFAGVEELGAIRANEGYLEYHIRQIIDLDLVLVEKIRQRKFKVVVDPVNSSGAIALPALLEQLGCETVLINGEPNGQFAHNPEPLPAHLKELCEAVVQHRADLGIAVDPDVDRLALVTEEGGWFGEEYTLVAVADYVLGRRPGSTVSNLSSTRALADVTHAHGQNYYAAAVGEVNVVEKMKQVSAVIGGEGNGGVILPELHYGRDALVGVALVLSALAEKGETLGAMRNRFPNYEMVKDKIGLKPKLDLPDLLDRLQEKFADQEVDRTDGLKVNFPDRWVHMRGSNTEPIIRIYAEAPTEQVAQELVSLIKDQIDQIMNS